MAQAKIYSSSYWLSVSEISLATMPGYGFPRELKWEE